VDDGRDSDSGDMEGETDGDIEGDGDGDGDGEGVGLLRLPFEEEAFEGAPLEKALLSCPDLEGAPLLLLNGCFDLS